MGDYHQAKAIVVLERVEKQTVGFHTLPDPRLLNKPDHLSLCRNHCCPCAR